MVLHDEAVKQAKRGFSISVLEPQGMLQVHKALDVPRKKACGPQSCPPLPLSIALWRPEENSKIERPFNIRTSRHRKRHIHQVLGGKPQVGTGAPGILVSKKIPDGLECSTFTQHMDGKRMPDAVRALLRDIKSALRNAGME